ncbi:hypothetical protein JJ685_14905 [Ramlibacter monticola]|uniref:Catalase immune-responsive domain-containing protein n=1 Tax=Ramlibacter monticola TaxID=1926872 RepID=A0A936Z169_9BURK|nr:hypothetical protein [Ramlibacter monticola]
MLPSDEKGRLTCNIANAMRGVPREIQERQIVHFAKADPHCGAEVARKLGVK